MIALLITLGIMHFVMLWAIWVKVADIDVRLKELEYSAVRFKVGGKFGC